MINILTEVLSFLLYSART
uniref:Uncharacterized protein n=1 Tax=Anguilla anguilla TaxID=7936 RepID=A0A0E9XZ49_ANGAN